MLVGIAGNISEENSLVAKFDGIAEIEDLKTVKSIDPDGKKVDVVISRTCELKVLDEASSIVLSSNIIPYGAIISIKNGKQLKKGETVCQWDPYNGVIILNLVV